MGFEMNFPALKLKAGHGEPVVRVLMYLVDHALSLTGFLFEKPRYPQTQCVRVCLRRVGLSCTACDGRCVCVCVCVCVCLLKQTG